MPEERTSGLVDRTVIFDQTLQRVLAKMAEAGFPMQVVSRNRTAEQQKALFDKGSSTTLLDGTTKKSHHQVGTGADLAFVVNGQPSFDAKLPWATLGRIAKAEGLTWGGDWKTPFDPGHIQLGGNLPGTAIGERVMPRGVSARGTFTQTPVGPPAAPAPATAQAPIQGPPAPPGAPPAEDDEIIVSPTQVASAPAPAGPRGFGDVLSDLGGMLARDPVSGESGVSGLVMRAARTGVNLVKPLVETREAIRNTAGVVLPATASIVGGTVGGAYGGPSGALGGSVALAPIGEAAAMGVEALTGAPPSLEDVSSRLGWAGGTALAGEGAGRVAIAAGRPFAKKVTTAGAAAIKRLHGRVTPAQVTDSRALDIAENIVSGSMLGGGKRTALIEQQNQLLEAERLKEITSFGGPVTREAAGRSVQGSLRGHPSVQPPPSLGGAQAAAAQAASQATAADQAAQSHVLNVLGKMGRTEPKSAGARALSAREREVAAFRAGERELYGDFEEKAGGILVDAAPQLDAFAKQLLGDQRGNIAPGVGLRAARRVSQLLAPPEETGGVLDTMTSMGPISSLPAAAKQAVLDAMGEAGEKGAQPLTAVEFQQTVSSLNRIVRQLTRAAQTDPTKNADLGMAKRLLTMAKSDMEEILTRESPEAFDALTTATGFSREGNQRLFNETVRKMAKTAPEQILGTLLRKDNSTAVAAVRRAIGDADFRALESAAVTRILRPNAKSGRVEWADVLRRIDQLGDDTIGAFTPGGEIEGLRDVARMALGHTQASKAAQTALRSTVKDAKAAGTSPQIRYLRKLVQADPDAVVDLITQSKRPLPVRLVRNAVPDTVWKNVQARVTEDLLEDLHGKALATRISAMGKDTLREIYPGGEDQGLQELSRILSQLQTTKEGTGKMWIQLSQAGAAAAVLRAGVFFGTPEKGAAGAGAILLGPAVLAKIMLSKTGRKWLTTGLTATPGSQLATRAASHLAAFAAGRPIAEGISQGFSGSTGTTPPPDNPFKGSVGPPPENPFRRQ